MTFKIKEVADIAGISVRTLHHYDQLGLLKPESTTEVGYRLYSDQDLEQLQQILFFKELGFSLKEIKALLSNQDFDQKQALKTHHKLLLEKKIRLEAIISLVKKTLKAKERGEIDMSKKEMFEAFDMSEIEKHQQQYAEETKQKYSDSEAYRESQKRTSSYTKDDWANIQAESNDIYNSLALLMDKDVTDPEVQVVIEKWRQHISKNFYNCTLEIFRGLGELYVQDERFTANIDKFKPGLAKFFSAGINVYCDNKVK